MLVAVCIPLLVLTITTLGLAAGSGGGQPSRTTSTPPQVASCPADPVSPARPFIGDAPGAPWALNAAAFTRAAGTYPTVIETYTPFGAPFPAAQACEVVTRGALPLVQWNPRHASLASIISGRFDRYLVAYARSVQKFRDPLVLSFAHEMNGKWFAWGYTHTRPATFVAAWRHVHDVFARAGARNVIWLWDINRDIHRSQPTVVSPPAEWWPGHRYVTWVGIDAYFNRPADTFESVFGTTLAAVRQFTQDPVLIAETAVGPNLEQATQIRSLFIGVRSTRGVLGFVWFDQDRRQRWHLENRTAAVTAFRQQVRG